MVDLQQLIYVRFYPYFVLYLDGRSLEKQLLLKGYPPQTYLIAIVIKSLTNPTEGVNFFESTAHLIVS